MALVSRLGHQWCQMSGQTHAMLFHRTYWQGILEQGGGRVCHYRSVGVGGEGSVKGLI